MAEKYKGIQVKKIKCLARKQNMGKINQIVAVVVTYNRKQLLLECLTAILSQSMPVHKLIIIDNASTDGTEVVQVVFTQAWKLQEILRLNGCG